VAGTVRRAQTAAAELREAWVKAGGQERARRREREGYAEGRAWKAVAMETWTERVQAMRARDELGGEGGQRGGWTMARALIQLKQRQAREKEARATRARTERVSTHREGSAAVVISTATTEANDGGSEPRSAALWVVLRIPHARSEAEARAAASTHAYWHEAVGRPPGGWGDSAQTVGGEGALLDELDGAARIVVAGRGAEGAAWRALYGTDEARAAAHREKMVEVEQEATRACGRRVPLHEVLRANGEGERAGQTEDTARWWWDGRLQAVLHACRREARAMARVAIAAEARLPGRQATTALSIRAAVLRGEKRGAQEEGPRQDAPRGGDHAAATWNGSRGDHSVRPRAKAARGEDRRAKGTEDGNEASAVGRESQATEADATQARTPAGGEQGQSAEGGSGAGTGRKRPQRRQTPTPADGVRQNRQRTEVETYDEMKRRGPRKRKVAYLTVDGQRTGAKRDSITAGVATLERVVAQRYDWRDAGLGATRKRRQGGLLGDEEEDARGKRRR
jgi:hypothetical protein